MTQKINLPIRACTCTPVAFGGGEDFFARDSGLMCRGLQSAGVSCFAVMPEPVQEGDDADLLRVPFSNLESVDWWRSLGVDLVVLYAWGSPKFRHVAAAIHRAGIFLVLNQDNGGLISPSCGWWPWLIEQRVITGAGNGLASELRFLKRALYGIVVGLLISDRLRAAHLSQGDVIACVSPIAAGHHRRWCLRWGGKDLANRVDFLPHPVCELYRWESNRVKTRRIVAVGRWNDDIQKRPELLCRVAALVMQRDKAVHLDVVGQQGRAIERWWQQLPVDLQARVKLWGRVSPAELQSIMTGAQVSYCSSSFESFHIASAEALCCGCSVVAARSNSLAALQWFVSDDSGTLVENDTAEGHADALLLELDHWRQGRREPKQLAERWIERLHASRVARQILRWFTLNKQRE